jgi:hypothetical protein
MLRLLRGKPISSISVALIVAVATVLIVLEIRHHWKYGHFVPLGMHADVTDFKGDIGDGTTIFFDAHLTNFGLFPQEVERCEFVSDAGAHEVSVAYRLEHLDTATHDWRTLFDSAKNFCHPYPLAIAQSKLVKRALWTGQTLSTGAEATAARAMLKGETMRFVIEANGREFPTGRFMIVEVYGH